MSRLTGQAVLPPVVPEASATRSSDAAVGAVAIGRDAVFRATEYGAAMVGITARLVWHGFGPVRALVPQRYRAIAADVVASVEAGLRSRVAELVRRGGVERRRQAAQVSELLDRLVPVIVAEIVERIDLTRLVTENIDLDAIADDVLDELDLPEIIRTSTGSLASNVIVGVRKRGIHADDVVAGVVDRLLRRDGR